MTRKLNANSKRFRKLCPRHNWILREESSYEKMEEECTKCGTIKIEEEIETNGAMIPIVTYIMKDGKTYVYENPSQATSKRSRS